MSTQSQKWASIEPSTSLSKFLSKMKNLEGSYMHFEVMWAIGQFTIAFSVVVWYFSPETESGKRDLPYLLPLTALWNGSTYHLGSMAWSGLLFGLCKRSGLNSGQKVQ